MQSTAGSRRRTAARGQRPPGRHGNPALDGTAEASLEWINFENVCFKVETRSHRRVTAAGVPMFATFSFTETLSAFVVLFAVIDIIGSMPIIILLKQKGQTVSAFKASLLSFLLMALFFYAGDIILRLFNVDVESFAVAGSIVIFFMALEMLLDVEIFKNQSPVREATLVPLVFPLIAGAGAFTTLISLRAEYANLNIMIALVLNMIWVYVVIAMVGRIEYLLGTGGVYIVRKFFGVILLAIAVKLFTSNIKLMF